MVICLGALSLTQSMLGQSPALPCTGKEDRWIYTVVRLMCGGNIITEDTRH